jgi:hypothetical protein
MRSFSQLKASAVDKSERDRENSSRANALRFDPGQERSDRAIIGRLVLRVVVNLAVAIRQRTRI